MEETAPRQARPVRTGIPFRLSAETLAMPPIRIAVGIGHIYQDQATGEAWTLTGLRSGRTVILTRKGSGTIRDRVDLETLADNYEHVGCDHESFCCLPHREHVMPHRGCMMR